MLISTTTINLGPTRIRGTHLSHGGGVLITTNVCSTRSSATSSIARHFGSFRMGVVSLGGNGCMRSSTLGTTNVPSHGSCSTDRTAGGGTLDSSLKSGSQSYPRRDRSTCQVHVRSRHTLTYKYSEPGTTGTDRYPPLRDRRSLRSYQRCQEIYWVCHLISTPLWWWHQAYNNQLWYK